MVLGAMTDGMFVKGRVLNEKSRKQFRWAFGKKKYPGIQTVKDVDRNLEDFTMRYPHLAPGYRKGKTYEAGSRHDMKSLGHADIIRKDPFPGVQITDERRNHD